MMHNNLFLNRMVIHTIDGKVAYDEVFHRGVNIIRGDNSSGKSTLTHFIFYILGGAFDDWVKEAKQCSSVMAEVELNGATVTLKRYITLNEHGRANKKESLFFFWGDILHAETNPNDWQKYNYDTTNKRKSYSNVLFDNLELPIVKGENNITFHQILRLLYIDQESPTSSLYLYEQFDSSLTRETISDLLLGVYSQELYDKKQRKIGVDKELDSTKREIKVIKQFIADPLDLIPSNLKVKIENKEIEIQNIETQIQSLKNEDKQVRYTKKTKLEFEKLNFEAISQREKITQLETRIRSIKFDLNDTELFVEALENKLSAVKKSILTREVLGEFPLDTCPECLSELEPIEDLSVCKLCKQEIDESFGISQARKIEQELSFQIKESNQIIQNIQRDLLEQLAVFESEQVLLHQLQIKVNQSISDVKPIREEKLDQLYVDKGFAEGEILQIRTLLENAELYQGLIKKQSLLSEEKEQLKSRIYSIEQEQESLKLEINKSIESKGIFLLNNDLKRQEDFYEAKEFHIDYSNNLAFISDKNAKYSASSSFYLKTSARFSIFLASLEIEQMRFPRFVFCDNMEDKGIEPERAQNFQRILISEANKYKSDSFQLIYTTSFIPDELNNTDYCIGDFYTKEHPSLKNIPG